MSILETIRGYVWGTGLILLLLTAGTICSIRLGFPQLKLWQFLKNRRNQRNAGISQAKTVCLSLGAAMGTGNITGAAAAVAAGGAGAVFWMWVSAFLGMALVYAENALAVTYGSRTAPGAVGYLSRGIGSKLLAGMFALCCTLASLGMGGMVQVNSFTQSLTDCTGISRYLVALILLPLIFIVVKGGAERIGTAAQVLLPIASVMFAAAAFAVLIAHANRLPSAILSIFSEALGFRQAVGGSLGYVISVGVRRGIFSNEAGLGSSPLLHSAAGSDDPHAQGMWSIFEVLADTVCCTLTALCVICAAGDGLPLTAFKTVLHSHAGGFLAAELGIFAFCTIIGWYYCGERAFLYLTGKRRKNWFPLIYSVTAAAGAVFTLESVWTVADIFNGLMALPNLVGVIILVRRLKRV